MSTHDEPPTVRYRLKEPVPYIQGFGLTYPQLDVVASAVLPYETINSYYGDVLVALRVELRKAGQDFTIVPFTTGPKGDREVRYLYILDVIPSWTGNRPKVPVPRETAEKFFNLYRRNRWLKDLRVFCIRWPSYEPEPEWLHSRLWESVKIYGDWVKQSMTPQEIEEIMQTKVVESEEELRAIKRLSLKETNSAEPSSSLGTDTAGSARSDLDVMSQISEDSPTAAIDSLAGTHP